MYEAIPAVLHYACHDLKLHRIEAWVEVGNVGSCKVLKRSGFKHECTLRDYELKNNTYISIEVYSIIVDNPV
jgi:ribosomal-protein-alanine N-acetyltransferase